ncbi:MAG: ABC transporter ATP-binding protein [Anaerolineales bacterium]
MTRPVLAARGLGHTYATGNGGLQALHDVTLSVSPHEIVGIVGPSGCGKTTLLKLLAGLLSPTAGYVLLNETELSGPRRRIGVVFQKANLMPWRTVIENVSLPLELDSTTREAARARAREILKLVGLSEFSDAYPKDLSGGMEQRVAIGRALVHNPDVLLLDEPFGALDALTREQMGAALLDIWRVRRTTIVLVTHSIPEAIFLSDRVLVLTPRPGTVREQVTVDLPRPRDLTMTYTPEFSNYAQQLRAAIG